VEMDRRSWLAALGLGAVGAVVSREGSAADEAACPRGGGPLPLESFRPRSMLHVKETRVATPRFPAIDVHTHFTWTASETKGIATGEKIAFNTTAQEALAVLDRKQVRAAVNLTGGTGKGLEATLDRVRLELRVARVEP
jgi:hypothetical protein